MEQGTLSVSTENIFPIIKQSLYSEQEIFLRELVSNAVDATQKLKHLASIGEFQGELGELKISILADKEAKTLTVRDAGLGMTADEVKKYLNQVAFSGAEEFVRKFKDSNSAGEIIGKFGLGFYSAFMVAGTVEVLTRSWQEGAEAVRWTCDGTVSYSLESAGRESRGTDVILHLSEDALDYLESWKIREILEKYCRFLPIEIEFEGQVVNNPNPVWKKAPADLQDEDYLGLFRELYPAAEDPLFWIHLNVDYPFTLNGILYFPRIRQDIDPRKNQIQLYSRQVFITDEVSQIVPDYLMLLQGVIDSPDIPLNVSRSYLQGDPNVRKIRDYITRKVADRLNEIFRDDRGKFEEKWRDISVFVKYGMLTDDKFYEKAEKFALVENMDGNFFTLAEYREKIAPEQTDSSSSVVYLYATDRQAQDMFIRAAAGRGYDVVLMNGVLDSHFIGQIERKIAQSRWVRVDSDTLDKLIPKEAADAPPAVLLTDEQKARIEDLFRKAFDRPDAVVKAEALQHETLPVVITRPEFMRRMREMAATGGMGYLGDLPDTFNAVINTRHPLVMRMAEGEGHEALASQLADLALLSQGMLTGAPLTDFIHRSVELLAPQAQ